MARKNTKWADPVDLAKDLSGKVYIVTGANSGVGLETTRQLVKQGAHVVMACRRVEAGEAEAVSFADLHGSHEVIRCDLADLQSVRDFIDAFKSRHTRLDGLMCNAGAVIMGSEAKRTKDGLEMTMAASVHGHFLMTELLLDVLKASAPSRIGIVSSVVHANSPKKRYDLNFEDLNWETRKYSAFDAYGETKLAAVLYALELGKRLEGTGVTTASIHPGWARSNFGSGGGFFTHILMAIARPLTRSMSDSNWASAQTSLHVLLSDDAPNHSGAYFSQSSVLYRDRECRDGGWPMESPYPNARDLNKARRLVAHCAEAVGLTNETENNQGCPP
ncbi:MAG: SDR family NAD(P)-dependent oxidoreductase [Rhodobacter sp.]|nr:SDR family NAD(P)-dependent oxidoreductase [Rhodobacter sp.]